MVKESFPVDLDFEGLVKACQVLSQDLAALSSTLNTAPVVLATLSKECKAACNVLDRFRLFYKSCFGAPTADTAVLDDICDGPLQEIFAGVSNVQADIARLARSDHHETSASQLLIVWNENSLKQATRGLSASRSAVEFLMNSGIRRRAHDGVLSSPKWMAPLTRPIQCAYEDKNSQHPSPSSPAFSKSPTTPISPSSFFRVSDLPGVRSALEELKPEPGMIYQSSPEMIRLLHDAIDRADEASVVDLLLKRVNPNAPKVGSKVSPLQRAFNQKRPSIATFVAVAGASLETTVVNGETALMSGIKGGFPDKFMALLCELGATIDATDAAGCSALHHAAASRKEDDTLSVLINAGADVNLRDNTGRTPLLAAAERCRLRSVDILTQYEADMEIRARGGGTALHVAVAKRHYMMTEMLADRGAFLDSQSRENTVLTLAISTGSTEIATLLVESGADVNLQSSTGSCALLAAAAIGDAEITELLLAHGASVDVANHAGYCPIHMAAHKNRVDVLTLLIRAGASIDRQTKRKETPLSIAVRFGFSDVVQHLVRAGVDLEQVGPGGRRPIFTALNARDVNVSLALVEGGADSTSPPDNSNITTPIHLAVELGLDDVVVAVACAGANLETSTWQGFTPLFTAAESGRLSTVRLLLEHGASIRGRSTSGGNVLFSCTGSPVILKQFIDLNVDVNERDVFGATALHYAALRGHAAGAKVLLQKGARVRHANSVFETPADFKEGTTYRQGTPAGLAKQKGHVQLAKMIERWKFKV